MEEGRVSVGGTANEAAGGGVGTGIDVGRDVCARAEVDTGCGTVLPLLEALVPGTRRTSEDDEAAACG